MKRETLDHIKKNLSARVINDCRCNSDISNILQFGCFDIILKSISKTYRKECKKYLLILIILIYLNNIS